MKLLSTLGALLTATLLMAGENQLSPQEKQGGWRLLFDGKTTEGWRGFKQNSFPEKGWSVQDGVLHLEPGSRAGNIITEDKFPDFDLRWEWKIPRGANNGLKYFILEERGSAIGHEYQMIDDEGVKNPLQRTATFYDVLPVTASNKPLRKPGEWNASRVVVKGNKVEHWLNGVKVLEYELGSKRVMDAVAASKFKDVKGFGEKQRGHILLTYHNDEVSYRNIKILELK